MTKKNHKTGGQNSSQIHVRIDDKGEICVWGLEREAEKQLLILTGNQDLAEQREAMSCNLCG
jgi:hypothetical protein